MELDSSRSSWRRLDGDAWLIVFTISVVMACLGFGLLMVEYAIVHHYTVITTEADGRDLCVLLDGHGVSVNRAFVDASEPCPVSDGWHTAERTTNSDLAAPVNMHLIVFFVVMILIGVPLSAIAAKKYLSSV